MILEWEGFSSSELCLCIQGEAPPPSPARTCTSINLARTASRGCPYLQESLVILMPQTNLRLSLEGKREQILQRLQRRCPVNEETKDQRVTFTRCLGDGYHLLPCP